MKRVLTKKNYYYNIIKGVRYEYYVKKFKYDSRWIQLTGKNANDWKNKKELKIQELEDNTLRIQAEKELSDINSKYKFDIDILSFIVKCLMLLLPFFALILKIFYPNQTYYNQIIYLIHNHIAVIIIITLSLILSSIGILSSSPAILVPVIFVVCSIYILMSSYQFYSDKIFITVIKYFLSFSAYVIFFWITLNIITATYITFGQVYDFIFFN